MLPIYSFEGLTCGRAYAQEWLLAKQKHIPDYDEIFCDNVKGRVLDLDPSKLCQSAQDWTDYIYFIITAEVLLLVCLIAKVSYDYWVFKTAGYLPWPANKMPKLPCDWLCEWIDGDNMKETPGDYTIWTVKTE